VATVGAFPADEHEPFRLLVESVADYAILMLGPDGTIMSWNSGGERIKGYRAEEVIGRHFSIFYTPEAIARGHPDHELEVARSDGRFEEEGWRIRKDGSRFWANVVITPLLSETGALRGYGKVTRDMSERRHAQEAERDARAAAERASRAKTEFLSGMSHELRTPLNAVLGFGQLLQLDSGLGEHQREHVGHIVRGGQHLLELINEVLDISRIESGTLALSPESVDVGETVRGAIALVRPLADGRDVAISCETCSGFVVADHQRLKQVLLNLLSNAIKYNRHGGQVSVSCARDGERVRIAVADTGPGIAQLERLFEPFDRLGAERSGIEGTGLGLALSRSLVELMGGTLIAANRAGEGAVFTLELPAGQERAVVAPVQAPVAQLALAASRVLYIEDNTANFRLVQELLTTRRPVEILPAIQGRLGVELARRHHPDLVLLDLHLPDMAGDVVLAQLQADPETADIPVLVVTADATPGRERRLLDSGAFALVTKPFDVPEFLRTVEAALAS
jgi:PAS domain S-box-containing protein